MNMNPITVLVTGASRGIGKAIARRLLAEAGVRLLLVSRGGLDELRREFAALPAAGPQPLYLPADISSAADAEALAAAIDAHGGQLDVLINNAGGTVDGAFTLLPDEAIESVLRTNLLGTMRLTLRLMPALLRSSRPTVINMSSLAAVSGKEGQAAYSASKGGLIGFARLLAGTLGRRGLVVNTLAPGFIRTQMVDGLAPETYAHILEGTPLARMGEVEEVAELCAFLATTPCRYLNATTLKLDGGFHR